MLMSSRGPSASSPLATSGSRWMIAPTVSVASPTASASPAATPSRAASRASGHASPRGGVPRAGAPLALTGSTSDDRPAQRVARRHRLDVREHGATARPPSAPARCTMLLNLSTGVKARPRLPASAAKVSGNGRSPEISTSAPSSRFACRDSAPFTRSAKKPTVPMLATASTIATISTVSSPARQSRESMRKASRSVFIRRFTVPRCARRRRAGRRRATAGARSAARGRRRA